MAIKSSDQITILDVTDAYSIMLSLDSVSLNGGTSTLGTATSVTVNVSAFRGSEQLTPTVGTPTCPTNVTASVGGASSNIVPVTINFAAALASAGRVSIPVSVDDVTIVKEFAFSISFKGATGSAPYSILVGNESQVIACDKDGKTSEAGTITIPFSIFQGTTRRAATVTYSALPDGITLNKNTAGTSSAEGQLILDVAAGSDLGGTDNGTITLTFKYSSTTVGTKTFTWSKSITGATGEQGPQGNPGTNGTAATSVVCGNEAVSIPCTMGGLVSAASTITIPFAGYIGTARAACTVAASGLPSGITVKTNTGATTSADGSLVLSVAKDGTLGAAATLSGEITLTFTCNSQSFVKKFAWSKAMTGQTGEQGPQGNPGADAITLVITSSNGSIFKNTSIATTLTAHVYKAGEEVTGSSLTALGTIKWYKDGGSTAVGTGATLSISAGDVTNRAVYEARLEG